MIGFCASGAGGDGIDLVRAGKIVIVRGVGVERMLVVLLRGLGLDACVGVDVLEGSTT